MRVLSLFHQLLRCLTTEISVPLTTEISVKSSAKADETSFRQPYNLVIVEFQLLLAKDSVYIFLQNNR